MSQTARNIAAAVRVGLVFAVCFSLIAVALFVVRGPSSFERLGVSLPQVLGLYAAGGIVAGFLVGLFRPFIVSLASAVVVGIGVAFPIAVCAYMLKFGPFWVWDRKPWIVSIVMSVVFGGGLAKIFYEPQSQKRQVQD